MSEKYSAEGPTSSRFLGNAFWSDNFLASAAPLTTTDMAAAMRMDFFHRFLLPVFIWV